MPKCRNVPAPSARIVGLTSGQACSCRVATAPSTTPSGRATTNALCTIIALRRDSELSRGAGQETVGGEGDGSGECGGSGPAAPPRQTFEQGEAHDRRAANDERPGIAGAIGPIALRGIGQHVDQARTQEDAGGERIRGGGDGGPARRRGRAKNRGGGGHRDDDQYCGEKTKKKVPVHDAAAPVRSCQRGDRGSPVLLRFSVLRLRLRLCVRGGRMRSVTTLTDACYRLRHWSAIEELSEILRYWEDAACVWGGSVSGADPRPRRYPRDVASTAQRVDWRGKVTASPRETALMLLASRAADASVCPSEVARAIAPEGWRAAMPSVHAAIDRLVEEGRVQLSWKGKTLPKRSVRGRSCRGGAGGLLWLDVAIEPVGHLPQRLFGRFQRAIAVRLVRQDDIADGRAITLQRGIHPLRLDREGAAIVVGAAVDQQDRRLDPVRIGKRAHLGIGRRRLPIGALFRLEAERGQRAVVRTRPGDAGAEQIGVREQVGGHERAIAVAAHRHAVTVANAELHHCIDGGLGILAQLFDIGVVRLRAAFADDRHRGIVEDRIALRQQEQMADAARAHEAIALVDRLTGDLGVGIFGRIGPEQRRQRPVTLGVIAGRQIQRPRQRHAVGAGIGDRLLGHAREHRCGIGEGGDGLRLAALDAADHVIGCELGALPPGQDPLPAVVEQRHDAFVIGRLGRPQPGLCAAGEGHGREEGEGARLGRAVAPHIDGVMAGGEAHHPLARGIVLQDRIAGIAILILVIAGEQHPALSRTRRSDGLTMFARGRLGQLDWRGVEGRGLHHHLVVEGDLHARVAAIERFGPDQRRGRIGAPFRVAWAFDGRVEVDGQVVGQRAVDERLHRLAVDRRHRNLGREEARGQQIGIGPLQPLGQQVTAVGRHAEVGDQPRRSDRLRGSVERDAGQLAGEIMVEQRLVMRVAEQILIGARGRGAAVAFLHHRAGRRSRRDRCGPAPGGDGIGDQGFAVGRPDERRAEAAVQTLGDDACATVTLRDPERQAIGLLRVEGDVAAIGRPVRRGEAQPRRQVGGHRSAAGNILEAQRVQPLHANLGLTVGRGVDPIAAQPQDRLGEIGDRRQVLAPEDGKRVVIGADGHRGGGGRLQRLGDRIRCAVIGGAGRLGMGRGGKQQSDQAGTSAHS
ncbi:hypothetical protein WR25_08738 [Diploscapter pachys]|uniref:Uncharacterized protein n=1 Tax=Diploscapter pachys TaxID=2018661 RepID=A0A2A2K4Y0_9BILA|nr:hypothetical protein WR25_08738 [Diploscapter pachys]